jgi:hypothetical protein
MRYDCTPTTRLHNIGVAASCSRIPQRPSSRPTVRLAVRSCGFGAAMLLFSSACGGQAPARQVSPAAPQIGWAALACTQALASNKLKWTLSEAYAIPAWGYLDQYRYFDKQRGSIFAGVPAHERLAVCVTDDPRIVTEATGAPRPDCPLGSFSKSPRYVDRDRRIFVTDGGRKLERVAFSIAPIGAPTGCFGGGL